MNEKYYMSFITNKLITEAEYIAIKTAEHKMNYDTHPELQEVYPSFDELNKSLLLEEDCNYWEIKDYEELKGIMEDEAAC